MVRRNEALPARVLVGRLLLLGAVWTPIALPFLSLAAQPPVTGISSSMKKPCACDPKKKLKELMANFATLEAQKGKNDIALIPLLVEISEFQAGTGAPDQAEQSLQRVLQIAQTKAGKESVPAGQAQVLLANFYEDRGQWQKARPLLVQANKALSGKTGKGDHFESDCLETMGRLSVRYKKYKEADQYYERALAIRRKLHGANSPDVASQLERMSLLYRLAANKAKVEQTLKQAIAIREKDKNRDALDWTRQSLGTYYAAYQRNQEAELLFKQVIESRQRLHGKDSPYLISVLDAYAELLRAQKRVKEAQVLEARSAAIARMPKKESAKKSAG